MPTNVALTGLAMDLAARADDSRPIRICLVGAGAIGTDIVSRVAHMRGIAVGAISELNPPAAAKAIEIAYGDASRAVRPASSDAENAAMEAGKIAVTDNVRVLLESGLIDIVVDATGVPAVGTEIGLTAMERGKHVVMMNVEADVAIGAYLRLEAERFGVVYSLGAGDEPSTCMELVELVSAMGPPDHQRWQGQEQSAQLRRDARRLRGGSHPPPYEPAHAGRVCRWLEDHG